MTGPFIGSLTLRLLSFLFSKSSEFKILFYFSPHFCISLNLLNKKLNNLKIRRLIYIIAYIYIFIIYYSVIIKIARVRFF